MPYADNPQLQQVLDAARHGSTILTLRTRASRWLLREYERRNLEQGITAWQTPSILTLGAWLRQCWSSAQSAGATGKVLLGTLQRQKLWEQLLAARRHGAEGAAPTAVAAWTLIHDYRIPENHALFGLTRHSREFAACAREYRAQCQRHDWIDEAQLAEELAALLPENTWLVPTQLVFWGFDGGSQDASPALVQFTEAVRAAGGEIEWIEAGERELANFRRVEMLDAEAELHTAAQWARAILLREPAAQIGIVLPELRQRRTEAERILLHELVPEFFTGTDHARAFDISLGPDLASYAVLRAAVLALRWVMEPLSFAEVRELLLSPYLEGHTDEYAARAILLSRLGEKLPEPVANEDFVSILEGDASLRATAPQLAAQLRVLRQSVAALPERTNFESWSHSLSLLLETLGWCGATVKLESTAHQCVERWQKALDAISTLDLVAPPVTCAEAIAALLGSVESATFAPENIGAPVQLLGHDEAAGTLFDYLWIAGLSDDSWPPRQAQNPFLPLPLLAEYGVVSGDSQKQSLAALRTLQRLASSSGDVIISSPQGAEGSPLRPSRMIAGLAVMEPAELPLEDGGVWMHSGAAPCESIDDTLAPPLAAEDMTHHGTKILELQSACPFRAFAEMRLGAGERMDAEPGVRRTQRGKIIERTLQLVWDKLHDGATLRAQTDEVLKRRIADAAARAATEVLTTSCGSLREPLMEIERRRVCELVFDWLALEKQRGEFTVEAHQKDFHSVIGGVPLHGYIDRLDRVAEGLVILDYKSSTSHKASHWTLPRPQEPQLPLYALAMEDEGGHVAALAFARITMPECSIDGLSDDASLLLKKSSRQLSLAESMKTWRAELTRLAEDHLAGRAEVSPKVPPGKSGSSCQYCKLNAFCRISEAVADSGGDEDDEGAGDE